MPTLNWIGKEAVVNHHRHVPYRLLHCDKSRSAGDPDSGNLLVQGDNLEALKALLPYYAGKVKCIYIDPPYNTGNENWIYNDNVNSPQIKKWLGQVVGKEAEDLTRHDKWLCMMYPRLALLREFLSEDGAIFTSIDDNEVASLRLLLDELFGRNNFITQIEWQKRYTRSNNTAGFTTTVEHIIVYARSDAFSPNLVLKEAEAIDRYKNPDKDPRGPWKAIPFLNPLAPAARPNLCYEIRQPNTGEILRNTRKAWRASRETYERYIDEDRIYWGKDGQSNTPNLKRFLSEVREGMPPINFWDHEFAGNTDQANAELKTLFSEKVFDTPKPTKLLNRVVEVAADSTSLILDSFAGSGTTGHAVLQMNKAGGGNRRFICIEMDETIARDVTAQRLRKVVEGYTNAKGEAIEPLGGGFRFCTLGKPLFDEYGSIDSEVKYNDLAAHVFFSETGSPLPKRTNGQSPLLGIFEGRAVYLLFNGILGDKKPNGGNVLTGAVLESLPVHAGPKVIYGEACRLGESRLQAAGATFKQVPWEVRVG